MGQTVLNLNVNKMNESKAFLTLVDVFTINDFVVVTKISKEIAIFIGGDEDDNECVCFL
jgi:hypothetical protein